MLEFIRVGGVSMLFILALGGAALVVAGLHARRPTIRRADIVRALTAATVFATLTGVCGGFAAVMHKVPSNPEWAHSPDLHLIVMTGLGEATANAILGFALLTLAWLLMAIAARREA